MTPSTPASKQKSWFQTNRMQLIEWPAQFADLNTTENLRADIRRPLMRENQEKTKEMWNVVQLTWAAIPVDCCQTLLHAPRCEAVIRNHG